MQISLRKIKTKNLAMLAQQVIHATKEGMYQVVASNELLTRLEDESRVYNKAYMKPTYSRKGRNVQTADAERTHAYRTLRAYLKAYGEMSLLPDTAEATTLYKAIRRFEIRRLTYAEKTTQLVHLIEELEKPEHAEQLKRLKLQAAFDVLKTKYEDFETLYTEHAEANAALRATPSATAIRKRLERALRDYIDFLKAMRSFREWTMSYHEVHELVKAAAIVYKNDRKKGEKLADNEVET